MANKSYFFTKKPPKHHLQCISSKKIAFQQKNKYHCSPKAYINTKNLLMKKINLLFLSFFIILNNNSCSKDGENFFNLVTEEIATTPNSTKDIENNTLTINEDESITIDFSKDDTLNKSSTLKNITQPKNGKAIIKEESIIYTPEFDFSGEDIFNYTINTEDSEGITEQVNTLNIYIKSSKDAIDDNVKTSFETEIIIFPLKNDTFNKESNISISSIEPANLGIASIKNDNSIIYTPNKGEVGFDTIHYTTQIIHSNNIITTETASINITIENNNNNINSNVLYWKNLFDKEWIDNDNQIDFDDAIRLSKSKNLNQEYYFLGYYIDGLVKMWQASGDDKYLDSALQLINQTINDASNVDQTYKGWPNSENNGHPLWDSFYWRHVATLLRIMYKSPNLRSNRIYQEEYDKLLSFTEKNIWNRYDLKRNENIYRINTHMTSHWARIAMELYIITNKVKYKEVFDNISFKNIPNRGSSLRNQLKNNPNQPSAYIWNLDWNGSQIQDTSHAGAIISFWVEAYDNNMYWNNDDITALCSTLKNVIWKDSDGQRFYKNIDRTGGYELHGRIHEWLNLGRYDKTIQNRIRENYTGKNLTYYGIQPIGIAALNAKILSDGHPIYPEIHN